MARKDFPRNGSVDSASAGLEFEASSGTAHEMDDAPFTTRPSFAISLSSHDEGYVADILDVGAPVPPDGGYGWVIVFASFICNLVLDGVTSTFGVTLPDMAVSFDTGKGSVAWAGSMLCGGALLMGPIVGALTNKFGCRIVCIAGGIIAGMGFLISSFATGLPVMLLSYGVLGGIGFGMIYLPAIVSVGYYFESKRALATGIAVCGSGFGGIAFAPAASWLLGFTDWRSLNLIYAGLFFTCSLCGGLMKPLEIRREALDDDEDKNELDGKDVTEKHLLLRMADDKKNQLMLSNGGREYFMVQLPDGTMEQRLKMPPNVDPGVHSSYNLDLEPGVATTPLPPISPSHFGLETIAEGDTAKKAAEDQANNKLQAVAQDLAVNLLRKEEAIQGSHPPSSFKDGLPKDHTGDAPSPQPASLRRARRTSLEEDGSSRNGSISQFYHGGSFSREGSCTGRERRYSIRAVPTSPTRRMSAPLSTHRVDSFASSKRPSEVSEDDCGSYLLSKGELSSGLVFKSTASLTPKIVRPLSRKDIFYSGSIQNLPEYRANVSVYRQSIISLPRVATIEEFQKTEYQKGDVEKGKPSICPCLSDKAGAFKSALSNMLDFSMLRNPVFLVIAISAVIGMLGFYTPFVYIVDFCASKDIPRESASWLISVIGIMNTGGRVFFGMISDRPQVNSLVLYTICLFFMGVAAAAVPFCTNFASVLAVYITFGLSLSGHISLTSIILVDLLGLDHLTSSFGLLIFFRGMASVVGAPLAGAIYDHFQSYDIPFYLAGSFLMLSALIICVIPCIKAYAPRKPLEPVRRFSLSGHLEGIPEAREPTTQSNSSVSDEEHLRIEFPSSEKTSPGEEDEKEEHILQFK